MPKGTSWAEATLNGKKIKPITLAIVELCWHQAVKYSTTQAQRVDLLVIE